MIDPKPGECRCERLETRTYRSGVRVGIPVVTLRGIDEGPTLTVLACQHGRELNGIESIRRAITQTDPQQLRGRVLFVPCANPVAVRMRHQDYPHEHGRFLKHAQGFNLNRVWPGDADGELYPQMADVLWREAIRHSDACIDLHGWTGASASLVWGPLAHASLVRAFGLDIHTITPDAPLNRGKLEHACQAAGIPCLTAELVPQKSLREASVAAGTRGILNTMKMLGMIDGEPELPSVQIELDDGESEPHQHCPIETDVAGLLVPRLAPPALVKTDDILADVVDLDDVRHTQPIRSPIDGVVFNVGGPWWGEAIPETNIKDAGETVAIVKSYTRIIRNVTKTKPEK